MSKTAQEWKELLNLDALPDDEFLADLNELEGDEVVSAGMLPDSESIRMTPTQIKEALLVEGVGLAFKAIRAGQGHTTRSAAQAWHLSPGRVSQIEQPSANLELATVADLASRMGYRTRIVFEPVEEGQSISATLEARKH